MNTIDKLNNVLGWLTAMNFDKPELSNDLEEPLNALSESISEVENLSLSGVVSSCVDKDTLISDLDDKRIVGVTLNEDMWYYCRKETAQHLLAKYEIIPK